MAIDCGYGPDDLRRETVCLAAVSKDLEGELLPIDAQAEECPELDCKSLVTLHAIKTRVVAHDCDSDKSKALLDGVLVVRQLTTVFADGSAHERGVHAGDFLWRGQGLVVQGRLQGITNAGLNRKPLRRACEECREEGVMIGRLCGAVVRTADPALMGALVTAVYRFEFDPTDEGGAGALVGVVEGALLQVCAPKTACVDFSVLGSGPNPRVEQGHQFEVFDHNGTPLPQTDVLTWGSVTGMNLSFRTTVTLAAPADAVRLTFGIFATPGTVSAFDASGALIVQVPIVGPQNLPIQVVVPGPGIARLEIDCPSNEHLLVELCIERGVQKPPGEGRK
jgi:hypothetical protein